MTDELKIYVCPVCGRTDSGMDPTTCPVDRIVMGEKK